MLARVEASAANCSLIIAGAVPLYPLLGRDLWRLAVIAVCFFYHWVFRRGCLGNYLAKITCSKPLTVTYITFYTAGFSTILFSIAVPFDLLACYLTAQIVCLRLTGLTIPSWLTGVHPNDPRRTPGLVQTASA